MGNFEYLFEKEGEAKALEVAARQAERGRDFDLAARLYRNAADAYHKTELTTESQRCLSIAETIDD